MKKVFFFIVCFVCFVSFVCFSALGGEVQNSTVDNSSEETIKIETGGDNSYIVIGDNNTFQIPELNDKDSKESKTPLIIRDNPQASAFVATSNAASIEVDNVETFFTQIVLRLNYDGTWELVWFEQ